MVITITMMRFSTVTNRAGVPSPVANRHGRPPTTENLVAMNQPSMTEDKRILQAIDYLSLRQGLGSLPGPAVRHLRQQIALDSRFDREEVDVVVRAGAHVRSENDPKPR